MDEIDWASDVPRWQQLRDLIVARIEDGTYSRGERVPSVVALHADFGVAAATAQKALRALREDGWTYTVPGLGSFVGPKPGRG